MYTYEYNYCDCHPETCNCNIYKIMQGDVNIATAFNKERAEDLCKRLNKEKNIDRE